MARKGLAQGGACGEVPDADGALAAAAHDPRPVGGNGDGPRAGGTGEGLALRVNNLHSWTGIRMPRILWLNTAVLLASSGTLEMARRKLQLHSLRGFKQLWVLTLILGIVFVIGQVIAWRQLAAQGVYMTSRLASSFFYVFTAVHAVHLVGGICALLYVRLRRFETARIRRHVAAEVASYYWHFMDGLWVFVFALLYFGR